MKQFTVVINIKEGQGCQAHVEQVTDMLHSLIDDIKWTGMLPDRTELHYGKYGEKTCSCYITGGK